MIKSCLFVLCIFISLSSYCQNQDRILFIYNVSFGAVTTTIGALINKPKNTKTGHVILRSLLIGGAGGSLLYYGKSLNYQIYEQENYYYGWGSRLVHNAGTSLMENAALNRRFLHNWHIDIGPVRVDIGKDHQGVLKHRFYPLSFYSLGAGLVLGGKFDWQASFQSGTMTFRYDDYDINIFEVNGAAGIALGHSYIYTQAYSKYYVAAHENIHVLQYLEYQIFNTWAKPISESFKGSKAEKVFHNYLYFELPYLLPFYLSQGLQSNTCYYNNFYEFEAERFATRHNLKFCD